MEMMRMLVAGGGCDLDFHYGKNGTTPLCWAAKSNNLSNVCLLDLYYIFYLITPCYLYIYL